MISSQQQDWKGDSEAESQRVREINTDTHNKSWQDETGTCNANEKTGTCKANEKIGTCKANE